MSDILVIGDSCRDVFVYCDAIRLAPDYPVPVLNVVNQTENPGMAMNVKRNISSFLPCDIYTNSNWYNITKTRYVHEKTNHMFFRVDTTDKIDRVNIERLNFSAYSLVVISDYNKGYLTEYDIEHICRLCPDKVFLDTKKVLGNWAMYAKYIKINDYEYKRSEQFLTPPLEDKIIRTVGGDGCIFQKIRYEADKVEVKDSSGAGDSFMAALAVSYKKDQDIIKAIKYANIKAAEVVKQRGVTII